MVKIITLSKGKERNVRTIEATFSNKGELIPLKVNENDRPAEFNEINKLIEQPNLDFEAITKELFSLMSPEVKVQESISSSYYLSESLSIRGGNIFFGEQKLEQTLASHMLSLLNEDKAPKDEKMWRSYVRFLDNLHQNANEDIRKQLFRWMEYENKAGNAFAITEDGCLVGYKGCEGTVLEPMSVFSGHAIVDGVDFNGKIPNKVGSVIQMPRASVQEDPSIGCSYGLHVGTRDYAIKWAPVLILVKVNPRDVVSVPYECDSQKMRVCEYTVLKVTDTSSEHTMFHGNDEVDCDEGALSLQEAYNLLGSNVYVEYDGHGNEGELIDVYEEGRAYLVVDTLDDGVLDIELSNVEYYEVRDTQSTPCTEDYSLNEEEALELLAEKAYIYIIRDDDAEYEGVVVDVYISPGKDSGVVLKDGDNKYSHVKLNRIQDWEEADSGCCQDGVCDGSDDCQEDDVYMSLVDFVNQFVDIGKNIASEIEDELSKDNLSPVNEQYKPIYKLKAETKVVIVYKQWDSLHTAVGEVFEVDEQNNTITILDKASSSIMGIGPRKLEIDFSSLVSIQEVK